MSWTQKTISAIMRNKRKENANVKTYPLMLLAVIAPLFAAFADYALFISGYPPAQDVSATTGTASTVALGMQTPMPSSIAIALDSRFRTVGLSNASALSSLPPGFCITVR